MAPTRALTSSISRYISGLDRQRLRDTVSALVLSRQSSLTHMLGWERNPHIYGKDIYPPLDVTAQVGRLHFPGFSQCSMLQAGRFPGQSPSRLLHRYMPYPSLRSSRISLLSDHSADRGLLVNLGASLELPCYTLLWSSYSAGTSPPAKPT